MFKSLIFIALSLLSAAAFGAVTGQAVSKDADKVVTVSTETDNTLRKNPAITAGLDIIPVKGGVKVTAGKCKIDGKTVTVKEDVFVPVAPCSSASVVNEQLKVPFAEPFLFIAGTPLRGPFGVEMGTLGSYNIGSLILRKSPYGKPLTAGKDYVTEDSFAMVCLPEGSALSPDETLYASYSYSLLRVDGLFVTKSGNITLAKGKAAVVLPPIPEGPKGSLRIANIFRPFRSREVTENDIFTTAETAKDAKTCSKAGFIPKTMEKIKSGKPVTIVCWGDSVTAGGSPSRPENVYVWVFERMLKAKYPKANITVIQEGEGGSNTLNWIYPDTHPFSNDRCKFEERVAAHKPDLVTVEFVNDGGFTRDQLNASYGEIMKRFAALGCECILITPHFVTPSWMGADNVKCGETRDYTRFLREFAAEKKLAVADAASRWEHLKHEGIPYAVLLTNGINHPEDTGHRMFAEELIKCFD